MIKFTVPRVVSSNWSHRKKVRAKRVARFLERTKATPMCEPLVRVWRDECAAAGIVR